MIEDPKLMSNKFNDTFATIADSLLEQNSADVRSFTKPSMVNLSPGSFFIGPFTVFDVRRSILNMDVNKSSRSDVPKIKFLKMSVEVIAPIVTKIFNLCIAKGVFPDSLKLAEVIPIFKSGSKSSAINYRPISLLSPFSKIFESHIYSHLIKYLDKYSLLYRHQFGFRDKSSTEFAVTQILDSINEVIQKKSIQCSVFLDLAKAFNTVNHKILLDKLATYGIRGIPLMLLRNYLDKRMQCTNVNSVKSNLRKVSHGVPQGSCLGPLLFLIYINDLPKCTNLNVTLFADDACLSFEHSDPLQLENIVNTELDKVSTWLNENKLFINHTKSNFLIFTKKKVDHHFSISIQDFKLGQAHQAKYLGIVLDDKLNWKSHIKKVKNKLSRSSYIIWKLKPFVNTHTLKLVYYSLVYPYLQYCVCAWGSAPKSNIDPVVKLQKRIVKCILSEPSTAPSSPLFLKLGMLKFGDIFKLQVANLMYKFGNSSYKTGQVNLTKLTSVHRYATRLSCNNNYFMNLPRTNLAVRSFSYIGPKVWRSVPAEMKDMSFSAFKFKFKKYLINLYKFS